MLFYKAPAQLHESKYPLPISPASSVIMGASPEAQHSPPPSSGDGAKSPATSAGSGQNSGHPDQSPQPDSHTRKRRRSRKCQDKKFLCPTPNCGKSYSRAEHLHRHQLNHNSKQVFRCTFQPDCGKIFVRGDLLKRHLDRHATRGSQLNRRDNVAQRGSRSDAAAELVTGASRPHLSAAGGNSPQQRYPDTVVNTLYMPIRQSLPEMYNARNQNQRHQQDIPDPHSPWYSAQRQEPSAIQPGQITYTRAEMYGNLSPISGQLDHHDASEAYVRPGSMVPPQSAPPVYTSRTHHPNNIGTSTYGDAKVGVRGIELPGVPEFVQSTPSWARSVPALEPSSSSRTSHSLANDTAANKAPYVGMPEDFMNYLFRDYHTDKAYVDRPMSQSSASQYEALDPQYQISQSGIVQPVIGPIAPCPQQVMAVNNLLDRSLPDSPISEAKSQEIFEFMKTHFYENSTEQKDSIYDGDRSQDSHMLSRRMMQVYISSYWHHLNSQLPIIHKPTFAPDKTPHLLLLIIMALGAVCLDSQYDEDVSKASAKLSDFVVWHLRWKVYMDKNFEPPAPLWIFQTLVLLELYEKRYSTRDLHERAHVHHATAITLMRRGRALSGKSSLEFPVDLRGSDRKSWGSSETPPDLTPSEWWNQWINDEATRRTVFAAFCVDSIHATMFGHSAFMVAHEMRLPLPCDESLWEATSSAEVARLKSNLVSRGFKPIMFVDGLKSTLSHESVPTTLFGRTVLMAGLLSVTYHMHQRDLQVDILGRGVIQALGGRDKWRATLTRGYDWWRADFDAWLESSAQSPNPYRQDSRQKDRTMAIGSSSVLHHLAHMSMHADITDCQILAGAKWVLGRPIGPQELSNAQFRVRERWAPTAKARDATFYALKLLNSVLLNDAMGPTVSRTYEARSDVLLNRPWVVYVAALVVWCYGCATEGPSGASIGPNTEEGRWQQTEAYLRRFSSMDDPNDIGSAQGINNNTAMLMILRDAFRDSRWELLEEGSALLQNCILINAGESM